MNVAYNFHKSSQVYRRSSAVLLPSSSTATNNNNTTTRADAKHGPSTTTTNNAAITSLNHDEASALEYSSSNSNIHTRTYIGPIDTDLALGGAIPKYGFILRLVKR